MVMVGERDALACAYVNTGSVKWGRGLESHEKKVGLSSEVILRWAGDDL